MIMTLDFDEELTLSQRIGILAIVLFWLLTFGQFEKVARWFKETRLENR